MGFAEFNDVLSAAMLLDEEYTEREAKLAYALSMMTVPDEMETDRHTRMEAVEFYEAVCGAAAAAAPCSVSGSQLGRVARDGRGGGGSFTHKLTVVLDSVCGVIKLHTSTDGQS